MAEEIEIVGVQVFVVAKAIARLPASHPGVCQARQPPVVERDRALRRRARAKDPVVIRNEDAEHDERHKHQIARDAAAPHEDGSGNSADHGQQSRRRSASVEDVEPLNRRAAIRQPARVFLGRSVMGV